MLLKALVFRFSSSAAREDREASGGGEPVRSFEMVEPRRAEEVGGRCETQSWTSSDTCGFDIKLIVFLEEGFVVIIMVGAVE